MIRDNKVYMVQVPSVSGMNFIDGVLRKQGDIFSLYSVRPAKREDLSFSTYYGTINCNCPDIYDCLKEGCGECCACHTLIYYNKDNKMKAQNNELPEDLNQKISNLVLEKDMLHAENIQLRDEVKTLRQELEKLKADKEV